MGSRDNYYGVENKSFQFDLDEVDLKHSGVPYSNGSEAVCLPPPREYRSKSPSLDSKNEKDDTYACGFGPFRPDCLQGYATKKTFVVVFSIIGILQGMCWSYLAATITTLEKRLKISSATTGIVITGNEVSQVIFSLILSHYGASGHRPRWIAMGTLLSACSCFVLASPHFIAGSGQDSITLTQEYGRVVPSSDDNATSPAIQNPLDMRSYNLCKPTDAPPMNEGRCENEELDYVSLTLIFVSQFVHGIGLLLFFTLGGPYLDDNTKRADLPMLFGMTMSLRLIGPSFGFLMASGTLDMYVNPTLTPLISPEDPRWVGCWWLGWWLIGGAMAFFGLIIALFPKNLKPVEGEAMIDANAMSETPPKLSEMPAAIKMLLTNKINVFNTFAGIFYLFTEFGYWTYVPKYLEVIYGQTASNASVIAGFTQCVSQAAGLLIAGYLVSRFQFRPRTLAGWNVATGLVHGVVMLTFVYLGCDIGKIAFGTQNTDGAWDLRAPCNSSCQCNPAESLPVCYQEQTTLYYSACHAGCESYDPVKGFSNCKCIAEPNPTVTLGTCAVDCTSIFLWFLAINVVIKFFYSTGRIGNMLISYRCVKLEERSLSIGLQILLISALASLPGPIVFGAIIDGVCLVWSGGECEAQGNCVFYDGEQLRFIFNVFGAVFVFLGCIFDGLVFVFAPHLDLYSDPDSKPSPQYYKQRDYGSLIKD